MPPGQTNKHKKNKHKKAADPSLKDCANCGTSGAQLACAKCNATHYCSKACQEQHWRNSHKDVCVTPEERRPSQRNPTKVSARAADAENSIGDCPICLESLLNGTLCTLPCKHEFHKDCVKELRKQGVKQACPICRALLPPGSEKLFEVASRNYVRIRRQSTTIASHPSPWRELAREMASVVNMYTNAANQGHAMAQNNLGTIYKNGEGVAQDDAKAVQWYLKAADQGLLEAQFNLGTMYREGKGVAKDINEAVRFYKLSAEQDYANAQCDLGTMHFTGEGVTQDIKEALRWSRKAADQGLLEAQHNLGTMYRNGKGVDQDYNEAVWWHRKAADQGYSPAQYDLATMYRYGEGVVQNNDDAVRWLRKAADQGDFRAKLYLGLMLFLGKCGAQDDVARRWYSRAIFLAPLLINVCALFCWWLRKIP